MKRKLLFYISAMVMVIIFWSAVSNATHSPGAKTGSPADGQNCTKCHTGTAQIASSWITTNIPASGYAPGQTYTITLTGTHSGVQRFGFEITAEDASNAKVGTFIITNSNQTQLTNMMEAVTHTGNGLAPSNNSKSWTFDWTAPAIGTGQITFYAALNAANGNMGTSGDVIYLTTKAVQEDLNVGITDSKTEPSFKLFPLPAADYLIVEKEGLNNYDIIVLDLSGKQLIIQHANNQADNSIDISSLPSGYFIIQLRYENKILNRKFVKQ